MLGPVRMLFCSTAATAAPEGDAGLDGGTLLRSVASSPCCTTVPASLDGSPGHTGRPVWRYRADWGPRPTGSLPEQWGYPDLPLVYATFGTVAAAFDTFTHVYARTLRALADEPVRVLLTTGPPSTRSLSGPGRPTRTSVSGGPRNRSCRLPLPWLGTAALARRWRPSKRGSRRSSCPSSPSAYRQTAETLAAEFTALPDVATLVTLLTDHARTAT